MSATSDATEPRSSPARLVCARCGCLCDDIEASDSAETNGGSGAWRNACAIGADWLSTLRDQQPSSFVDGSPAGEDVALRRAREMLDAAGAPLILAGPALTLEAAREVALLARAERAALVAWPRPPRSLARRGLESPESTATLGEVKSTADLVLLWRVDVDTVLPRWLERYAPLGQPRGVDRRRVLVDEVGRLHGAVTASRDDVETIGLRTGPDEAGGDADLITLAALLGAGAHAPQRVSESTAAGARRLRELLDGSRHTHVLAGAEAADRPAVVEALDRLAVRERAERRVTISIAGGPGSPRALEEACTWLLGCAPPVAWFGPAELGTDRPAAGTAPAVFAAGVLDGASLLAPKRSDLVLRIGAGLDTVVEAPPLRVDVSLGGDRPSPGSRVHLGVAELDPRCRSTVVRSDGIGLSLCGGRNEAEPDALAELLSKLRRIGADR